MGAETQSFRAHREDYFLNSPQMLDPNAEVVRKPAKFTLGGRKFLHAGLRLKSGESSFYLARFATMEKQYLLVFDLEAENEQELAQLAGTLDTLTFQGPAANEVPLQRAK